MRVFILLWSAMLCVILRNAIYELVKKHNLCFNCLALHKVSQCSSKHRCKVCNKKHHTGLCRRWKTWKRWKREYFTSLREFQRTPGRILKFIKRGDVVEIHDDQPCLMWKLAVVEDLIIGTDGLVRAAHIHAANHCTTRPIVKLYALEVNPEAEIVWTIPVRVLLPSLKMYLFEPICSPVPIECHGTVELP